jgi:hypothetical protein
VNTFAFCRYRWRFRALDKVHFPRGKSGNVLRGAFGISLRETATTAVYRQVFEPRASGTRAEGPANHPSGLADWPRPFLFRTAAVDGLTIPPASPFSIDMHLFDARSPLADIFATAFRRPAVTGLGPGRGRIVLEAMEQLDLEGRVTGTPCVMPLDPQGTPVDRVCLRFVTPTELKMAGEVADRPEFAALFKRLRDRIANLCRLYGPGPLDIDFRAIGERADTIRLTRCEIAWERVERRSSRTGQVHWMGGFTGQAEYEGELAEFVPWLRAAHWTGVGRQTVWGKGDVQVVER